MARKDVDLVIRAKDEAENVVKSITKALNGFIDAQTGLQEKADGTEGALQGLGAAIGQLDKSLKSLDIGATFTQDMDKAAGAVARLEKEVASSQGEFAQLERRVRNAETATTRYQQKLDGAAAAQNRQSQAVARAKKESKELAGAYDQSVAAVEKLSARFDRLPPKIIKSQTAFEKTAARVGELREQMAATTNPTRTLTNQLAAAERNLISQTEKLTKLRAEYNAVESELRSAGSAVTLFAGQSEAAARNLARQETILGKISGNLTGLGTRAKAASADQSRLEGNLEKTSGALARQVEQLGRAEGAYVELAEAAGRFDSAVAASANVSRGNLEQQLVEQGIAARKAREEFERLDKVASAYSATMLKAGPPTREVSQRIQFLAQRADEAQMSFMLQEETLQRMGNAYREVSQDMLSVTNGQARFIAAQEKLAASMTEVANDGFRQRQAIRGVHQAADRAAGSVAKLAGASRSQADAARRGATETGRLADAYRRLYGDTRQSLSYTQRLRGEVLSLIAAYGGFYGVIEVLRGVVGAYQTLEAAQARLNVALEGDVGQAAQEMDFLRRTANRLGVDLGTLATEYSKFAIATQGTNLAGQNTRRIFISVAEAARVNRSTTEEMSGVFTALTQIVSKGAVQMEELRQQLGDRLPGAIQIMADGLGVTTAELIKMMEAGEVTADALVPFSEELSRRFGPGLADALAGTSVALGRLKNAAFQALVQFGEGGFIAAFTDLANKLTTLLQDADFEAFLGRASAAFAVLIDTLGVLADNFDLVVAAITGFLGLKLTPLLVAMVAQFAKLPAMLAGAAVGMRAFAAGTATASATAGAAAASVGRLTLAIRALMSSTGIGLLVTAVSVGIGLWATRADEATEALNTHQKIVDEVRNAYDAVGGSVEDWRNQLNDLTATEAQANLNRIEEAVRSLEDTLDSTSSGTEDFWTNFFGYNLRASVRNVPGELRDEIERLSQEFSNGNSSAEEFYDAVDEAVERLGEGSDESTEFAERVIQAARALEEARDSAEEAGNIVRALGDDTEDAQAAFDDLGNSAEEAGRSIEEVAAEKSAAFTAAMREMAEGIESVNRELEYIEASQALEELGRQAIENAQSADELAAALGRVAAAQDALDVEYGNSVAGMARGDTGTEAAASLLRQFEGFRETPYWDVNAYRTGYGSDTITLSDGTIQRVTQGMRVSVADANRDLIRRIETEFGPIARQAAGGSRFDTFNPQQQAALISIAYNYGEIPDRIAEAVRSGTNQEIAQAIRSLGGDNDGVNRGRRNQEAGLFVATDPYEDAARRGMEADERRAEEQRRLAEEEERRAARAQEATDERLADGQFELEQQRLINAERGREAAIREAVRDARREDPDISEAELATIREQAGALYDLETAQDRVNAGKERAQEAEERVNQLLTQRNALEEQFRIAQESGDTELAEELRVRMSEVNAEMMAAIDTARQLWEAVGGADAETAIAQLDAATASARRFGQEATKNYLDWSRVGDLFINGLTGAFDKFAQAVANGEDAGQAAREAFLQFASDFLLQIAKMIVQQAILNALKAAFGGTGFGALIGIGAGHTGGVVGSSRVGSGNQTRSVNPAVFAGAMRYHTGGMIGLRPGEVPIIAKQGEEMLTRDDPRHALNGGATPSAPARGGNTRVVNAFDGTSFLEEALKTRAGEEVLLNYVSANRSSVRSALGV